MFVGGVRLRVGGVVLVVCVLVGGVVLCRCVCGGPVDLFTRKKYSGEGRHIANIYLSLLVAPLRRIYRRGFRDLDCCVVSALGKHIFGVRVRFT